MAPKKEGAQWAAEAKKLFEEKRRELGVNIRARRKAIGMSQADVAREIGISSKTLCNVEMGLAWPSLPMFVRLCKALRAGRVPLTS